MTELLDIDAGDKDMKYLLMVTKKGYIKKTEISEYKNINKNGLIAVRLNDGDRLVTVLAVKGRATAGVHAIRLSDDDGELDEVVGAVLATDKDIFTISADGNAKRNKSSAYHLQGRNGRGVRNFKKGYEVVALVAADDNDELVGVSEQGITIKTKASQISSKKARAGQGVILQRLEDGDRIASIDVISSDDDVDEDEE